MDRELNAFEALNLLGTLEALTRESLPHPVLPEPFASPPPSGTPAAAPARPSLRPEEFETTHDEYKPALQDSALIEALLQFQQETLQPPQQAAPKVEPIVEEKGFIATPLAETPVIPKPPGYFRKSAGIYHSILRPARP